MTESIKTKIRTIPHWPKKGIMFKDVTTLIKNPEGFKETIDLFYDRYKDKKIDKVIGIESRGFLFAAPVALQLGLGLSVIRKKGKLPRKTVCVKAPNEYAVEYFEMHTDSIKSSQKVLIVDDLIATGSSLISAIDLVKGLKGKVIGLAAVVELSFLKGLECIKKAHPDVEIFSLIKFDE